MAEDVRPGSKGAGKPVEAASAAPGEKRAAAVPAPAAPVLAKASESGDPTVQKLLAERWAAQQNAAMQAGIAGSSAAQAAGHDDQVAQINATLAELGFE